MEFMVINSLHKKGAILGLILPFLSFLIYSQIVFDGDIISSYNQLKRMNVHTHVMSLCTSLNLVPFLIFVRNKRDQSAKGILMITIILALFIMINKFLF
ncbi:MAG: hypothetical protein CMP64_05325 [Flavobacteriales bacterium]|nr:hypothetical protein [Flavobacteriales bacterium]|tara:strand:- start:4163 stop:4459 length:297 start_codon:yes stop_codon:yes gene_type:complete